MFWETNAVYVKSLDQLGQRVVFARDGETNQTVNLEASLIGVYTLRCFCIAWSLFTWGNKIFILSYSTQAGFPVKVQLYKRLTKNALGLLVLSSWETEELMLSRREAGMKSRLDRC